MTALHDLYQKSILEHYKKPRNYHVMESPNRHAEGFNPLCGDKIEIFAIVENQIIRDISFAGTGCAISIASASLLTESLKGKAESDAYILFDGFHRLVTDSSLQESDHAALGELAIFFGVREYPGRVQCATLAWITMRRALQNYI